MRDALRTALEFTGALVLTLLVLGLALCLWRTWVMSFGPDYERFLRGSAPEHFPNGNYASEVLWGLQGDWRGKIFEQDRGVGRNVFEENGWRTERYGFRMSRATGVRDNGRLVLKLDYNTRENPFWLRLVLDEVVVEPGGQLFGKMYLRIIPNIPFGITYFTLSLG